MTGAACGGGCTGAGGAATGAAMVGRKPGITALGLLVGGTAPGAATAPGGKAVGLPKASKGEPCRGNCIISAKVDREEDRFAVCQYQAWFILSNLEKHVTHSNLEPEVSA
jgi:hypothetical protein